MLTVSGLFMGCFQSRLNPRPLQFNGNIDRLPQTKLTVVTLTSFLINPAHPVCSPERCCDAVVCNSNLRTALQPTLPISTQHLPLLHTTEAPISTLRTDLSPCLRSGGKFPMTAELRAGAVHTAVWCTVTQWEDCGDKNWSHSSHFPHRFCVAWDYFLVFFSLHINVNKLYQWHLKKCLFSALSRHTQQSCLCHAEWIFQSWIFVTFRLS